MDQRLTAGVQKDVIGYAEGRPTLGMTGGIEIYQAVACREEELWISREGVPVDGFPTDTIPAFDGLAVVDRDVERVIAGIAGRGSSMSAGSMILHGKVERIIARSPRICRLTPREGLHTG